MTLVHNEQTKLLANALDRASTACFTVGIATPVAGYVYGIGNFSIAQDTDWLIVPFAGWFVISAALHVAARRILRSLKP